MGQLADFYAGAAVDIGRYFTEMNLGALSDREKVPLHVDFSLQLSPYGFETLTESVHEVVGDGPSSFMECLEAQVGGDGESSSADRISAEWVGMFATLDSDQDSIESVLSRWVVRLRDEYGDSTLAVTEDMRAAVRGLAQLCRDARGQKLDVVHTWSL